MSPTPISLLFPAPYRFVVGPRLVRPRGDGSELDLNLPFAVLFIF
jgi:hypothetical protein